MFRQLPSARKLARLNRRQRKKVRVGEFQELVFEIRVSFRQPTEDALLDTFLDDFIGLIESRGLAFGGGVNGSSLEGSGVVSAWGRGSPTDEDRQAVLHWLQQRPEVETADVGAFVDGWYGWEDEK
jgi:uncharacterized protein YggL (DUF469 family)